MVNMKVQPLETTYSAGNWQVTLEVGSAHHKGWAFAYTGYYHKRSRKTRTKPLPQTRNEPAITVERSKAVQASQIVQEIKSAIILNTNNN
jgi:hypothetical protein